MSCNHMGGASGGVAPAARCGVWPEPGIADRSAAAPALRPTQGDEEEEAADDGDGQHPRVLKMEVGSFHGSGRAGAQEAPAEFEEEEQPGEGGPDEPIVLVDDGFADAHLGAFESVDLFVDAA